MMYTYYAMVALDLARERTAEADAHRLAARSRHGSQVGVVRRLVARAALALARAADDQVGRVSLSAH